MVDVLKAFVAAVSAAGTPPVLLSVGAGSVAQKVAGQPSRDFAAADRGARDVASLVENRLEAYLNELAAEVAASAGAATSGGKSGADGGKPMVVVVVVVVRLFAQRMLLLL